MAVLLAALPPLTTKDTKNTSERYFKPFVFLRVLRNGRGWRWRSGMHRVRHHFRFAV
jgi:hypothetical protein